MIIVFMCHSFQIHGDVDTMEVDCWNYKESDFHCPVLKYLSPGSYTVLLKLYVATTGGKKQ